MDEKGNEIWITKYWDQNYLEKDSISEEIEFGSNARNLTVKAWTYVHTPRKEYWKSLIDEKNLIPQEYEEFLFKGREGGPTVITSY